MKKDIENRVLNEAEYVIKTNKTIREIAEKYNVSKSTVHKDLSDRLYNLNETIANNVSDIMQNHISVRHINGGLSTKNKYKKKE